MYNSLNEMIENNNEDKPLILSPRSIGNSKGFIVPKKFMDLKPNERYEVKIKKVV